MRAGRDIETKAHCQVYHAVDLFYRLQGESPQFIEFGWRLSGVFAEKVRKWRNWRLSTIRKARHWRAFLLLKKEILRNADCLADLGGFELAHSRLEKAL
jgi:hypothetical protein